MTANDKVAYQIETEEKLQVFKSRIASLEKQIKEAEADIKVRYDQKMAQIRGQYDQVKEKLDALRASTHTEWLDLKTGLDHALGSLSEALDSVTRHFSARLESENETENG